MARPINTSELERHSATRASFGSTPLSDQRIRRIYQRTLATWTLDVLNQPPKPSWQEPDPIGDYRNRDWRQLYTGNILDD